MLDIILAIENEEERNTAEDIWNNYQKQMYCIASKILKNPMDVDDAVMNAVRNMVANIKKFVGLSKLDTICLLTIYVKNESLKIYNKNKKILEHTVDEEIDAVDFQTNVEKTIIKKEEYEIASKHLESMSEAYSYPYILKHYYDYSIKEIMQTLGLSEAAVKKRLVRAKQQLLVLVDKEYGEDYKS